LSDADEFGIHPKIKNSFGHVVASRRFCSLAAKQSLFQSGKIKFLGDCFVGKSALLATTWLIFG
jgi:hypothetical protein